MNKDVKVTLFACLVLACITVGDAFFLRWGSEPSQSVSPKAWVPASQMQAMGQLQPMNGMMSSGIALSPYRAYGGYQQSVYEPRKTQYQTPYQQEQMLGPLPISVPMQASLTPVALQHVQLVPCMCPVAAEEAEKLHEAAGPGPYLAQATPTQDNISPKQ